MFDIILTKCWYNTVYYYGYLRKLLYDVYSLGLKSYKIFCDHSIVKNGCYTLIINMPMVLGLVRNTNENANKSLLIQKNSEKRLNHSIQ